MGMESMGFSDLLRNTSEEIFLKTMMENTIGIGVPSMEMLGFKNISQSFRVDSEELFNSWLANGEVPAHGSSTVAHRTRQVSRRISADFASSQQNGVSFQKKNSDDNAFTPNLNAVDEHSNDPEQFSLRNAAEKGMYASNLYLAKAWFHSSQPMTRSRSSELRRRYAAMQSSQMAIISQAPNIISFNGANKMQLDFTNTNDFSNIQMRTPTSSPSLTTPPIATTHTVSSVVSMLKGTLERKKLGNRGEKEIMEANSYGMLDFHETEPLKVKDPSNLASFDKSLELSMEGFLSVANQAQMRAVSQDPSQSESSTAAPALSTGFEVCDGTARSGYTISNGVSFGRHVGNGSSDYDIKANDYKDRMFENSIKEYRKKSNQVRMGSVSSATSVDKADPTKKRRVERSRKMAEAKERNSTPPLPSDFQAILRRCETLEKEVRSLKLNLSFMNRKDSEQTKQIEELQKHNDELVNEKDQLLGEIERIA